MSVKSMPTAAKLTAAAVFAVVALISAHLYIPTLPEGSSTKYFREVSALIGLAVGWMTMGKLAGKGYSLAIGSGLRTSITILFWVLLVFGTVTMIRKSLRMMYDGPMEAVLAVFNEMLAYGALLAAPATPVALALGGILGGMIVEWVSRRWS